jgi:diguanylate cyclase (GGDEF)-like protein
VQVADGWVRAQARALLQVSYQRLRSEPVDRALLERHAADPSGGRNGLLCALALASVQARDGEFDAAAGTCRRLAADAALLGEPVLGWVATAWLGQLAEAQVGRTEASVLARQVAAAQLERVGADRAGRFEALLARRRVAAMTEAVARDSRRLWEDALTSVGNRRLLDELLADPANARRPAVFADVDRFKAVNDGFGHEVGDEVLRRAAALLRGVCRSGDVVARYGGDEFVVLLADAGDPDLLAERLRTAVAQHRWDELRPGLAVSLSVGTAAAGPHALARADTRLRELKAMRGVPVPSRHASRATVSTSGPGPGTPSR